ncbi:MAG: serine/threonine-protein kinase [Gemmataceae bacterium]|nr:serine/threonine-protein kinase [Gemmataceae bacterium]
MADDPFPPTQVKGGPAPEPSATPGPTPGAQGDIPESPRPRTPTPDTDPDPARTAVKDLTRRSGEWAGVPTVTVPGYEVFEKLGEGGMGVVYRARDEKLGREVALKLVAGEVRPDDKAVIRFLAEAQAAAAVRHPNVVQVYDYGEFDGRPYMALEYCPGKTLADRLRPDGPDGPRARLDPRDAAGLVRKVAEGVAAAHGADIVHRDLKPGNILFDAAGEPKVADFGLAKRVAQDLTRTGAVMGTPAYMAPEQVAGKGRFVGPAADVWALGVILYECLAGARPFDADSVDAVYHRIVSDAPGPVRAAAPGVSRDLELVCGKCLEKEPPRRYAGGGELADDLRRFLAGRTVKARPVGPVETARRWAKRNPVAAALVAAVAVLAGGLAGAFVRDYRRAVDRAAVERELRGDAERLAGEKDALAKVEEERRREAEQLARENATLARVAEARRRDAADEAGRANKVTDLMVGLFASSDPLDIFGKDIVPPSYEVLRKRTAVEFLDEAKESLLAGGVDPLIRAKLLAALGNSNRSIGRFAEAGPLLREALALCKAYLPADHRDLLAVEFALGQMAHDTGDYADAVGRFGRVLDAQTRAGADPKVRSHTRGFLAWASGESYQPGAEELVRDEIRVRTELYGPHHRETLWVKIGLAAYLLDAQRAAEALPLLGDIRKGVMAQPGDGFRAAADAVFTLQEGIALRFVADDAGPVKEFTLRQAEAKVKECVAKLQAVLPAGHIYFGLARFELGAVYHERGNWAAADGEFTAAWDIARKTTGLAHPKVITLLDGHAQTLLALKRPDRARELYAEVESANVARFGPDNFWRAHLLAARGNFELQAKDPARAAAAAREVVVLAAKGRLLPARHNAILVHNLAISLPWDRHADLVDRLFAAAVTASATAFGESSPDFALHLLHQAMFQYEHGDRVAAAAQMIRAERLADGGERFVRRGQLNLFYGRATVEHGRGELAAAEGYARRAYKLARELGSVSLITGPGRVG